MKRLLLVNPYFLEGREDEVLQTPTSSPPLGLGFLATYVRDHSNWKVEIVDPIRQGLSRAKVLEKVRTADVLGLSCYTDNRFECFDFAQDARKLRPDIKIIIGGAHTHYLHKKILEHYPFIDVVVRGEGEETLLELLQDKPYQDIRGITWRQGNNIFVNPDRPFIKDIDSLYIDYSLFPNLENYEGDLEVSQKIRQRRTLHLTCSRGCPYRCIYCSNEHWRRTWRAVSPQVLVERVGELVEKYRVEHIRFFDDLFTAYEEWVLEVCHLIQQAKLPLTFRVLCRAGTSQRVLQALKRAGCVGVGFGVESGSDRILRRINKKVTSQMIYDTIWQCKQEGLWTIGSFIISLPDQTLEDIAENFRIYRLLDSFQVIIHKLYPATPFYEELKARGEIDDEIWFDRHFPGLIIYSKESFPSALFTMPELQWLARKSYYYNFVTHPKSMFKKFGLRTGLANICKAGLDLATEGRAGRLYRRLTGRPEY